MGADGRHSAPPTRPGLPLVDLVLDLWSSIQEAHPLSWRSPPHHRFPLSPPTYHPQSHITCPGVLEVAIDRPDRSVATGSARTGVQLPMVIQAASAGHSDPAVELARRLRLALQSWPRTALVHLLAELSGVRIHGTGSSYHLSV
jgi:hypothetical protein